MYSNRNYSDAFINDQEIQTFSAKQTISEDVLYLGLKAKYNRHDLYKITLKSSVYDLLADHKKFKRDINIQRYLMINIMYHCKYIITRSL